MKHVTWAEASWRISLPTPGHDSSGLNHQPMLSMGVPCDGWLKREYTEKPPISCLVAGGKGKPMWLKMALVVANTGLLKQFLICEEGGALTFCAREAPELTLTRGKSAEQLCILLVKAFRHISITSCQASAWSLQVVPAMPGK